MELRNTSRRKGFTLIEVIVVIGLLGLIAAIGLFISFDFYKSYSFRSEKSVVISALQKARGQALANINQSNHGVHYGSGADCHLFSKCYVIFEGNTFNAGSDSNNEIQAVSAVSVNWTSDVLFNQLDGAANSVTITLTQDTRSITITTNNEGRIDWQ